MNPEQAVGEALRAVARVMVDAGASPSAALRLVAFMLIEGALGPDATRDLGMPQSTAYRWRAELRDIARAADLPDGIETKLMDELRRKT